MNQIELIAVWTMKNYVLMIIEISAGTTMYRWMEYEVLTVTMIIYDQKYVCMYQLSCSAEWCTYDDMNISWNNNDVFAVTMMIYDKSCE